MITKTTYKHVVVSFHLIPLIFIVFRVNGFPYASLVDPSTHLDICKGLVTDGILLVEKRRERRLAKLVGIFFIKSIDQMYSSMISFKYMYYA